MDLSESTQDLMGNEPYSSENLTNNKLYSVKFSKTELGFDRQLFDMMAALLEKLKLMKLIVGLMRHMSLVHTRLLQNLDHLVEMRRLYCTVKIISSR